MKKWFAFLMIPALLLAGCATKTEAPREVDVADSALLKEEMPAAEETVPPRVYDVHSEEDVIYLAGGCFWGMQKYLHSIPGVEETVVGYANGEWKHEKPPSYETVTTGQTGFRETVYVKYDPEKVSLDTILFAFYYVIDPTITDRQGGDFGTQYQTGIYYTNQRTKEAIERITAIEAERYSRIAVEIESLEVFYEAEEYHQHYLVKNPDGVCHINEGQIVWMEKIIIDPADYKRPSKEEIKDRLTPLQYQVTQENYTEAPFDNAYWDFFEKGIYVDVVSGEPLFSSLDKFESLCGWPAFSQGIDINTFFFTIDTSLGTERLEVRSRAANSHLGHVFQGEASSPTGTRYCINSAALRFVPYEEMEAEGYGYLRYLLDESAIPAGYKSITAKQAKEIIDREEVIIVDVREEEEYQQDYIPDAVLFPVSTMGPVSIEKAFPDKDSTILIYCRTGNRSKSAAAYFASRGYTAVYEFGGIADWPYEVIEP